MWTPTENIEELYKMNATGGNQFASTNAPTAGARDTIELPVGKAPIQFYSLATPNGQKPGILLEELGVDYDAHVIGLSGAQFSGGFTGVNPNSKIPAAVDMEGPDGKPINLFESGAIVLYFAEKYGKFIPSDPRLKAEVMNWVFWQMGGQGPMAGNFGHFFVYAPDDKVETRNYGVTRYGMETQRMCDVLDKHLAGKTYMVGEEYTIADIMCYPWFRQLQVGYPHKSGIKANEFLNIDKYTNAVAWANRIWERPAVKRGVTVCGWTEDGPKPWLKEKK
jgi:GST-like protein